MRPTRVLAFPLLAWTLSAQEPELALTGLDPVALARGQEVAGREDLVVARSRYRYRFADEQSKAEFERDPERWEIQWDGACGRMGPRSGRGSPHRWHVHDGRIFIFASDACRDGFRKAPARFLPEAVPEPAASDAARRAGREWLDRAIAAFGGAQRFSAIKTVAWSRAAAAGDTRQEWQLRVDFAAGARLDQDYFEGDKAWPYAQVLRADGAFALVGGAAEPMGAAAQRELEQELLREPLLLLRRAGEAGVLVAAHGTAKVGDRELQLVDVWRQGFLVTIGIDRDGRVRSAACSGRGPQSTIARIELEFDDFTADGLARKVVGRVDGKPSAALSFSWERIAVDAPLPAELFARKAD